jgi:glyoxylase-like metal-dependent hydrolase (beta-lactamase superfamily II)
MLIQIYSDVFQQSFSKFGSCVYILKLKKGNFIIDTSTKENKQELLDCLMRLSIKKSEINGILLTHSHYDHIGNNNLFINASILTNSDIQNLGIRVIKTPGHTSDSVCFLYKDILFSGDTLFYEGIGRTDLPGGDEKGIKKSLEILNSTHYKILCPGHI